MNSRKLQYSLPIFIFLTFGIVASWFLYSTIVVCSSNNNPNTEFSIDHKSVANCDTIVLEVSYNHLKILSN